MELSCSESHQVPSQPPGSSQGSGAWITLQSGTAHFSPSCSSEQKVSPRSKPLSDPSSPHGHTDPFAPREKLGTTTKPDRELLGAAVASAHFCSTRQHSLGSPAIKMTAVQSQSGAGAGREQQSHANVTHSSLLLLTPHLHPPADRPEQPGISSKSNAKQWNSRQGKKPPPCL